MRLFSLTGCVALMALTVIPAMADDYTFTIDHCTGGCGTLGGTITVAQDGINTVKLTVNLPSGFQFVNTGFDGSFAFNIQAPSVDNPTISVSNVTSGWTLLSAAAGTLQFDGFGNLEYAMVCTACGNGGSNPQPGLLTFDVTATGLTPTSFAQLSTIPPGSARAYFVADVLGTTGLTGPIGATAGPSTVPEPTSVLLFASGLIGIGALVRRQRTKPASQN
jgi:hypothetical protein